MVNGAIIFVKCGGRATKEIVKCKIIRNCNLSIFWSECSHKSDCIRKGRWQMESIIIITWHFVCSSDISRGFLLLHLRIQRVFYINRVTYRVCAFWTSASVLLSFEILYLIHILYRSRLNLVRGDPSFSL